MAAGFDLTLSFDNGPEPAITRVVLDILLARDIKATFFVVGAKIAGSEDCLFRARAEGHWIGAHTWSHGAPLGGRAEADLVAQEIERTQNALGDAATQPWLFRPNGGGGAMGSRLLRWDVADYLRAHDYTTVLWNAVPGDFADPESWVEPALAQCRQLPWTLMVLHDIAKGCLPLLPRFLDAAQAEGARFRQDFPPDCLPADLAPFTTQQEPFA